MKTLVCGSRHFIDYKYLSHILDHYVITEIIHGAARGADTLAGLYATEREIPIKAFPADWTTHGKRAGFIRNAQMLKEGQPDVVIAFRAKDSRGTQNMINQAERAGIQTHVIEI